MTPLALVAAFVVGGALAFVRAAFVMRRWVITVRRWDYLQVDCLHRDPVDGLPLHVRASGRPCCSGPGTGLVHFDCARATMLAELERKL